MMPAPEISLTSSTDSSNISWNETLETMQDVKNIFQSEISIAGNETPPLHSDIDDDIAMVSRAAATIDRIEKNASRIEQNAKNASSKLKTRITKEEEAYNSESNELRNQKEAVETIQSEVNALTHTHESLLNQDEEEKRKINLRKEEVAEEIEELDMIEVERMREVPRVKRAISMYAMFTGIKWNYDRDDMLEGIATIPTTKEIKRFSVNPELHSKFDVANTIWNSIEGRDKRLLSPNVE